MSCTAALSRIETQPQGRFSLDRNVANGRALHDREAQFRRAIETSADGYWMTDLHGHILEVNDAYIRASGYSRKELLAMRIADIEAVESPAATENYIGKIVRCGFGRFESRHRAKNGRIWWVEITASHCPFTGNCVFAFIKDITQRKSQEERLTHQANTDYLTGMANRRHFSELAEIELMRSTRYGNPLSVLLLDIDHFKSINDTFGHKTGDIVLQKLAETCKNTLREIDVIGRWGGEEFAALLPETPSIQAAEVADRLRAAIANAPVKLPDATLLHFTVSIGCASRTGKGDTFDSLTIHADKALYEAKRAGRNGVCTANQ